MQSSPAVWDQHVSANFQKEAEPRVQADTQGMEQWALKAGATSELSSEVGTKGDTEARWESQRSSKEYIKADVPTQSMPS